MTPVPGPAPRPDASDTPSSAVERLSQANRVLAQVSSASDAADVRDIAEAARVYARQMHLGTAAVNHATSIKVRAELRLAALVDEGQARGEIATPGGDTSNVRTPDNARPATLSALGLDRWPCRCEPVLSSHWVLHGPSCDRPWHRRQPLRRVAQRADTGPATTTSEGRA
jgi:hypothetical protein